jgi:hypothetical protein
MLSSVGHGHVRQLLDPALGSRKMPEVRHGVRRDVPLMMAEVAYNIGDKVIAKGQAGTLKSYQKSWWTVELEGGGTAKSRAGDLTPVSNKNAVTFKTSTEAAPPRAATLAKDKGSDTATRASKPAKKTAVTNPPSNAEMSPALERVLDTPTVVPSATSDSVASYPTAFAEHLDASSTIPFPDEKDGAKGDAKYPDGLSRVLDSKSGAARDDYVATYPGGLAEVLDASSSTLSRSQNQKGPARKKKAAAKYPDGLSRVMDFKSDAAQDTSVAAYPGGLAEVFDASSTTLSRGQNQKGPASKQNAAAKYPDGLSRVLDSKSGAAGDTSVAAYPGGLASVFDASSTTLSRGQVNKGPASNKNAAAAAAKYPDGLSRVLHSKSDAPQDNSVAAYPSGLAEVFDASSKPLNHKAPATKEDTAAHTAATGVRPHTTAICVICPLAAGGEVCVFDTVCVCVCMYICIYIYIAATAAKYPDGLSRVLDSIAATAAKYPDGLSRVLDSKSDDATRDHFAAAAARAAAAAYPDGLAEVLVANTIHSTTLCYAAD